MSKKLFAACLVIAAFAVVPSLASAKPILTQPTGTVLGAGASIVATNVGNTVMTTSTGNLTCSTAILEGKLSSNVTANGAKGEITKARFGGTGGTQAGAPEPECTGEGFFTPNTTITPEISMPWCLEAGVNADVFTVRGGACGAAVQAIKFNLDVTGVGTCEYSRATAANGTLVTHGSGAGENTGSITNQAWTKIGGPFLCPSEGKLDMTFSLKSGGNQVFISS
jgi:hypothetical protein